MAWIVRLVKLAADGENQSVDVIKINRPDDLSDTASLGLTLADGKPLLAASNRRSLPWAGSYALRRPDCRSCGAVYPVKDYRDHAVATLFGQVTLRLRGFPAFAAPSAAVTKRIMVGHRITAVAMCPVLRALSNDHRRVYDGFRTG